MYVQRKMNILILLKPTHPRDEEGKLKVDKLSEDRIK